MGFQEHVKQGNEFYENYMYADALNHYRAAIAIKPKNATLFARLGRVYLNLEDFGHAEEAFKQVLALAPDSRDALYELGRIYYKQGRMDSAIQVVSHLIAMEPGSSIARKLLVRILLDAQDPEAAEEHLQHLLAEDPYNSELIYLSGRVHQARQQWDLALQIYQKLLAMDPPDKRNLKYHIYALFAQQELYDKAVETLEEILSSGTGTISRQGVEQELIACRCRQAEMLVRTGHTREANDCYSKILGLNPESAYAYKGLGALYAERHDPEKAIECYFKALQYGAPHVETYIAIAQMYEEMDRFTEAIGWMEKVEAARPSATVFYYMGTLYGLKGDLIACIKYLNKAVSKDPRFVDAYYNLGVALERQNKLSEALGMFKKAMELDQGHREAKANYLSLQTRIYQ